MYNKIYNLFLDEEPEVHLNTYYVLNFLISNLEDENSKILVEKIIYERIEKCKDNLFVQQKENICQLIMYLIKTKNMDESCKKNSVKIFKVH